MPSITFAFYMGIGSKEPFINRLTAFFTGKCLHCEVVFASVDGTHEACGVWQGEETFMRPKRWMKRSWRFLSLPVTAEQRSVMYAFCRAQAAHKRPFNKWGFYRCITPFPRKTDGESWFCSELCMSCLHTAGLMTCEVAASSTPSGLYASLLHAGAYRTAAPDGVVDTRLRTKGTKLTRRWFV